MAASLATRRPKYVGARDGAGDGVSPLLRNWRTNIRTDTQYYSERWKQFEHANLFALARITKILSMMEAAELEEHPRICDLGCGAGWATGILGTFGEAIGVDLAPPESARQRYPYCEFIAADILEWRYPTERFDLVVSQETLEHFDVNDQGRYLDIARGLLRQRGHLTLTTPNRRTMEAFPGGGRTWSNQPIENWLYAEELRNLLHQRGFQPMRMTSFVFGYGSLGVYRLANSHKLNRFLGLAGLQPIWRGALGRANFGLHLAVLARKI
jgi:SAM-dependent methyltransferase